MPVMLIRQAAEFCVCEVRVRDGLNTRFGTRKSAHGSDRFLSEKTPLRPQENAWRATMRYRSEAAWTTRRAPHTTLRTRRRRQPACARAGLVIAVQRYVETSGETQARAGKRLGLTQPRLSDLLRGRIEKFSLDALVNMLARVGKQVEVKVKKAA